jgi:hypothetical protein
LTNCTGNLAQYDAVDKCKGFCSGLPAGTSGDTSGDTLGCRLTHATLAAANPTLHCPHAGPTGGDNDPKGTTGTCGEPCDAFCKVALMICPTVFTDMTACATACSGFKADTGTYNDTDTNKNDLDCRVYHLTNAAASASAAATHCPHIAATSAICTM